MYGATFLNTKKRTSEAVGSHFEKKRKPRGLIDRNLDEKPSEISEEPMKSFITKQKILRRSSSVWSTGSLPEGPKKVLVNKKQELAKNELARYSPYGLASDKVQLRGIKWARQELYFILHDENYNVISFRVLVVIITLIVISTTFYILETLPSLSKTANQKYFWEVSELLITILFTIEYILRLIVIRNVLLYIFKPMNLVDLLSILPFYVEIVLPGLPSTSLRVLRVIRLARLGRMRHLLSEYIEVMSTALRNAADEAGPMMTLMILVQVVLFGSIVYAFENGHHDDGDFNSIPNTMWWAFVTITTVGYGDLSPVTVLGRTMGVLCMFSGIVLMSICVIIIGGNFEQAHQNMLTDKIMMKQKLSADPALKNADAIKHKDATLPEKKLSDIFEHTDRVEQSISVHTNPNGVLVLRTQGQELKIPVRNFKKKFGDVDMRIGNMGIESDKSINGATSQFPWLLRSDLLNLLSEELLSNVMVYLNDNDRFRLRELNFLFYKAYYSQSVSNINAIFDFKRSINLSMRDRVFSNVKFISILPNEVTSLALASISVHTFPNLRVFNARCRVLSDGNLKWHRSGSLSSLRHRSIQQFDVCLSDVPASGHCLLELCRFPNLKKLSITFEHPSKYPLNCSHCSLQTINLTNGTLENKLDRKNFPALRKVHSCESRAIEHYKHQSICPK